MIKFRSDSRNFAQPSPIFRGAKSANFGLILAFETLQFGN